MKQDHFYLHSRSRIWPKKKRIYRLFYFVLYIHKLPNQLLNMWIHVHAFSQSTCMFVQCNPSSHCLPEHCSNLMGRRMECINWLFCFVSQFSCLNPQVVQSDTGDHVGNCLPRCQYNSCTSESKLFKKFVVSLNL